ncbi:DUF3592 domain-containing protein [Rubritalea marina]|uniref:DUF3592 domain-containing protein n=1 Tax=Rubritalea marina TaxID=361055 RepID=UPI00036584D6|nr:DUF3592 domain-containing protein [Rubritalea marina]
MAATPQSKASSTAGMIYLIGMGCFLFFLGGGFCWLMWKSYASAKDTRAWQEVPCLVIQSEMRTRVIGTSPEEYQWKVLYKYQFEGQDLISEHFKPRGQRWRKDPKDVQSMVEQYPVGLQTTCYVNPEFSTSEPGVQAVLKHDTLAAGYSIWFPALFSVGGIGIIVGVIRKKK